MWRLSTRCGSPVLSLPPLLSLQNFLEANCTRAKSSTALLAQHDYLALFTNSYNIYVNLAVEEALLRALVLDPRQALLLCYVDTPCVVIGRNQNLLREVACRAACGANVKLARRYSGGGAVYHDTGNLCLSFLTPRKAYAPERTIQLVRHALCAHYAIDPARLTTSPRHDLFLDGRKITGSAMRVQKDIALHHCTLLVDSVRRNVGRYLHEEGAYVSFEASATSSVRATVTTLQECLLLKSSSSLPFCTARSVDNIDIFRPSSGSSSSNDDNARQERQNNNDSPFKGRTTRKRDTHRVDGCIEASKDNYTTHYHNNDEEDIHTCVTHSCEPERGMTAAVQDLRQYMAHFFLQHADTILTHPTPWQLSLPESYNTHAYSSSEITAATCVRRGHDATSSEDTQAAAQATRQVCHSEHRNGSNRRGDDAMTEAEARMLPAHKDITTGSSTASHNLRAAHDRVAREHAEEEHDEGNGLVSTLPVYVLDVVASRTSHNTDNDTRRRCSEGHTQSTNSDERQHSRASGTKSKERPSQGDESAEEEEELTAKTTSCVVDCPLVWGEGRRPAAAESRTLAAEVRHLASIEWRWAMPPFTTVIRIDAQELQAALHERLSTPLSQHASSTSTLLVEQCRAMDRPTHALSGGREGRRSGRDSEEDEEAIMIRRVLDALVALVFPCHHQKEEVTGTMYNDDNNTAAMTTLARVATTSPAMTRAETATIDEADVHNNDDEKKERETVTMAGRSTRKTTVKAATSKASHEAQKVSSSSSSSSSLHIRTTVEHRRITHLSLWRQQNEWNVTAPAFEGDKQRRRDPYSTTTQQQEESNNNRKQNTRNNNNYNNDNNSNSGSSGSSSMVGRVKSSEPEVHSAPEMTAGVVASTQVSLPWLEAVLQALLLHTSCDAHHLHLSEDKPYDCTTATMSSMAPSCDNDNEEKNASGLSNTATTTSSNAGVHTDVSHSTRHVRNGGSPDTILPRSRGNNSDVNGETRTSSNSADNTNNINSRHPYHVKAEEEGTTERMVVQGLQMEMSRAGVELPLDCMPESELYEAALLRFVHAIWRCWRHKNVFDFGDTTN